MKVEIKVENKFSDKASDEKYADKIQSASEKILRNIFRIRYFRNDDAVQSQFCEVLNLEDYESKHLALCVAVTEAQNRLEEYKSKGMTIAFAKVCGF